MNTKQYLGQMRNIDRLISDKLDEAERWRAIAENKAVNIGEISVQTSKNYDKMGDAVSLALDFENECRRLATDLVRIKHRITRQIDLLGDNPLFYNILKAYYIREKTLNEIAVDIGYSYKQTERYYKNSLSAFELKYGYLYLGEEKKQIMAQVTCP